MNNNIPDLETLQAINFFAIHPLITEGTTYAYIWNEAIIHRQTLLKFYIVDLLTLIKCAEDSPSKAYVQFNFDCFTMRQLLAMAESMNINKNNMNISFELYEIVGDKLKYYNLVNEIKI